MLPRVERHHPRTFLDESGKEHFSKGGMTPKKESNDYAPQRIGRIGVGRYFGFRLFDEGLAQMREEVRVCRRRWMGQESRICRVGGRNQLFAKDRVDVIGLRRVSSTEWRVKESN